jgi:integrase/recombinase XerD
VLRLAEESKVILPASVRKIASGILTADRELIRMWLHGRPAGTVRHYASDASELLMLVGKPIAEVSVGDLQRYYDSLANRRLAPSTIGRKFGAVKSLFSYGFRLGLIRYNPAPLIRVPKGRDRLAERILTVYEVHRMIELEPDLDRQLMLRVVYASGLRISEAAGLRRRDVAPHGERGVITVFGKGSKTRSIAISAATYDSIAQAKSTLPPDAKLFPFTAHTMWRIVRKAARRAGLVEGVSPHWLRHSHASHAADQGAPLHLIRQTLGHESIETTARYMHVRPDDSSALYLGV